MVRTATADQVADLKSSVLVAHFCATIQYKSDYYYSCANYIY